MSKKPILCVDFDGVIHSYTSGWKGHAVISDPPVPGALKWLLKAIEYFNVYIYSSRSKTREGINAMTAWFAVESLNELTLEQAKTLNAALIFASEKPPAFLTIDDRAIQFNGDWKGLDPDGLLDFRPWYQLIPSPNTVLSVDPRVSILPSGDISRLKLSKDGVEMHFTKEQARSLQNEIERALKEDL